MIADTSSHGRQLVLPVGISNEAGFENFFGLTNRGCMPPLKQFSDNQGESYIFLSGPAESGKTHLASAVLNAAEGLGKNVGYVSLKEFVDESISLGDFFSDLSALDILILEDVDAWLSTPEREESLFNLFNQFKMRGQKLLITARTAPRALPLVLPDLISRLRSGLALRLNVLPDNEKQKVLQQVAAARGVPLSEEVSAFIIRRSPRNMGQLLAVLDSLERSSLIEKRVLTVPFVKRVLGY